MKYVTTIGIGLVCLLTSCAQGSGMRGEYRPSINAPAAPGMLSSGNWIDKLSEYVLMQQSISKQGDYQQYFAELRTAKDAREKGDWAGQYEALNRFIDKLDSRAGGIADKAARSIREYTYLVEPPGYHDLVRDRKIHPEVDKWEKRKLRQREEVETPQAS
ncbi:hypothetical protein [Nitrospira sp. Nam74]